MTVIATAAPQGTGTNRRLLARRERLRPGWPLRVYSFWCEPVGAPPTVLWDVAHTMRRLWNDLARDVERVVAESAEMDEAGRREAFQALTLQHFRAIATGGYKGVMPSACYYDVVDRFQVTFKKWRKRQGGQPRFRHRLTAFAIPLIFNRCAGDEEAWEALFDGSLPITLRYAGSRPGAARAEFPLGAEKVPLPLRAVLHRTPPPGSVIKRVTLCGREVRPFNWQYHLAVLVEEPPAAPSAAAGRAAGLDLGWRVMEDGLRLGVLTTAAGETLELRLPFTMDTSHRRRERLFVEAMGRRYGKGSDVRDLIAMQAALDERIEACKAALRGAADAAEKAAWTEEVRASFAAIEKMRSGGLLRMRHRLNEAGVACRAVDILTEWEQEYVAAYRTLRALQLAFERRKEDLYRQLAAWIAKYFDVVAWEGDLGLKEMAEGDSDQYAITNAQRWRQLAGLYRLRLFVREAMAKRGRLLLDCPAADSTRTCHACGGRVEPGASLVLTCENGHPFDQDFNASRNFLAEAPDEAPAARPAPPIPEHLRGWLRALEA